MSHNAVTPHRKESARLGGFLHHPSAHANPALASAASKVRPSFVSRLAPKWTLALFCLASVAPLQASVTGKVFKDFNGNGVKDNTATFNEVGMPGVVVKAFATNGSALAVTYTSGTSTGSDGAYSVASATPGQVRLEFIMPDGYTFASNGAVGGATVMFPKATTQDLAVNYPNDYSQANPQLIVPCYVGGTLTGGGAALPALVRFNYYGMDKYIGQAGYIGDTPITDHQHLGAVYGVAYSRQTKKVFVGAVLRRHVVFGPLGVGGLYQVDPITGAVTNWLDIETLAGVDAGTDPRDGSAANSIPANPNDKSYDYNAFALIGKMSLGDVEISEDGSVLYVVNLFQQTLVAINTATKALIGSYPISASALGLACPQGDFRPWGLKYYKGKVYVGAVCSAQSSQSASNLNAYVLSFDPANPSGGFSNLYSFSLGYTRETSNGPWKPWNQTSFDPGSSAADDDYNPQPILSNLEFDVDGSLIMAFLDRHAIMFSSSNGPPDPTASSSASTTPFSAGDTLRACPTSTGYALEGTAGCPFPPGMTEFYDDRRQGGQGNGNIKEDTGGALALLAGSGEIASTAIDEYNVNENGIGWWSNTTGVRNRAFMIFDKNVVGAQGKTSGLGDIELLADAAPLSVGNRVWADGNTNGIQDAGESGIGGAIVTLKNAAGTSIASATTDPDGNYYFSNGAGTDTASAKYNLASLTYSTTGFKLCIATSDAALGGKSVTAKDADTSLNGDERDSDAVVNGANAEITFDTRAPGANNYSLDFGFSSAPPPCTISDLAFTGGTPTCNDNGTPSNNTDDYFLSDVTVTYANKPATGNLVLSGAALHSTNTVTTVATSAAGTTTYTFTGVRLKADNVANNLTATFSADTACTRTEAAPSVPPCSTPTSVASITPLGKIPPRQTCADTNPLILIPCYMQGNIDGHVLVKFPLANAAEKDGNILGPHIQPWNIVSGNYPDPTPLAENSQIGTVWGLAYQYSGDAAFTGAYAKRKSKFGPNGTGAIYKTQNIRSGTATNSLYVDLNAVFGANTAGANPHPTATTNWNDDAATVPKVGKIALGDLDISLDGTKIYAVNLADRQLYVIPTAGALNSTTITRFQIPTTVPGCAATDIRPFGLGVDGNGTVYVGGVCSAESTQDKADLRALVWRFDGTAFQMVMEQQMDYGPWEAWATVDAGTNYQQPMLSDIDFDGRGMILSFRDRFGDQVPQANKVPGEDPWPRGEGDVLRAYVGTSGMWQLESNAATPQVSSAGAGNGAGPGGGEFFYQDDAGDTSTESALGSAIYLSGTDQVVSVSYDAANRNNDGTEISDNYDAGGVQRYNAATGAYLGAFDVYHGNVSYTFGKASGLGDIEATCNFAASSLSVACIGNQVFCDLNNDGVLDTDGVDNVAGNADDEVGIDGVTLTLCNATGTPVDNPNEIGTQNYTVVTGDNPFTTVVEKGWYEFYNLPPGNYTVKITTPPSNKPLSSTDASPPTDATPDDKDNGIQTASGGVITSPVIALVAGEQDTSVDFGLTAAAPPGLALGNLVFKDNNSNGKFDAGDVGIDGVKIQLFTSAGVEINVGPDGILGTTDDASGGMTTSGGGCYYFQGLAPGDYYVKIPASEFGAGKPLVDLLSSTGGGTNDTTDDTGDENGIDDATPTTNGIKSNTVNLAAGTEPTAEPGKATTQVTDNNSNLTVDLGFVSPPPAALGNIVFCDYNKDGIRDADGSDNVLGTADDEPGISGVIVSLCAADGSTAIDNPFISGTQPYTVTTDADGLYAFTGLAAGSYTVKIATPPPGKPESSPAAGTDTADNQQDDDDNGIQTVSGGAIISPVIALVVGETDNTLDFGLVAPPGAGLGDIVFCDTNKDGIRDADGADNILGTADDEPGIAGVVVSLCAADGTTTIDDPNITGTQAYTVTTDTNGLYAFTGLAAGSYTVKISTPPTNKPDSSPAGVTDTADNQQDDDDNGIQTVSGGAIISPVIVLAVGEVDDTIDFGLTPPPGAALGNIVFCDTNNDGIRDADGADNALGTADDEPGIPGVVLTLRDASGAPVDNPNVAGTQNYTATTDSNGVYAFTGLAAGNYTVKISTPPVNKPNSSVFTDTADNNVDNNDNGAQTTPGGVITSPVIALTAGETDDTVDFGLTAPALASLGNLVFFDKNADGLFNSADGDIGIDGVVVALIDETGAPVDDPHQAGTQPYSITTGDNPATVGVIEQGYYCFTDLPAGNYTVKIVTPPAAYPLSSSATVTDSADNQQDNDDNGIQGGSGAVVNSPLIALAAGENDKTVDFGFVCPTLTITPTLLPDGTISVPYSQTLTADSNAGPVTWTQTAGTLPAGITVSSAGFISGIPTAVGTQTVTIRATDAGGCSAEITLSLTVKALATLGDLVWKDLNGNGQQDSGEPGIPGVTVTLYDSAGAVVITDTTDASGLYQFVDLLPGTYSVGFPATVTSGAVTCTPTIADLADDTKDSDLNPITGKSQPITLVAGDVIDTIDAGYVSPKASLGNLVWKDLDRNGKQDVGEPGIEGVTVTLYDSSGTSIGTTLTDVNGFYSFADLNPGTYSVGVPTTITPGNCTLTLKDQGTDDTADSDATVATGKSPSVTLAAGENNPTIDFGYLQPKASLGDFVWKDLNRDGIQDPGEPGIANVTVTLYNNAGTAIGTTTTDTAGHYLFDNLAAGIYRVGFPLTMPDGCSLTLPNIGVDSTDSDAATATGKSAPVTLAIGAYDDTTDAGYISPLASLGDFVWKDTNGNGVQDSGEPGLEGVSVQLLDANSVVLQSTLTDATGHYSFHDLAPGDYAVKFPLTFNGCVLGGSNAGADDTLDSDANSTTGATILTMLVAGENDPTWDAGYVTLLASLGDLVFKDLNRNGAQDPSEPGLSGLTVKLLDSAGTEVGSTVTDSTGHYLFDNLQPGTYKVKFPLTGGAPGCTITTANVGDDTKDSDAGTDGITPPITLAAGASDLTWDAGYITPDASLGDYVWKDTNRNGIQDAGEPGLAGVSVTLLDSTGGTLATVLTDSTGHYSFSGLLAGTYAVSFPTLEHGCTLTTADQGTVDGVDSDANPSTGKTINVTLAAGENNSTLDAGYIAPLGSIGDFIWKDLNRNSRQDVGEPGLQDIVVTLYDATGTVITTTNTDPTGHYEFAGLVAGTYTVGFPTVLHDGCVVVPPAQGTDPTIDSDANQSTGKTLPIVLAAGQQVTTVDSGYITPLASLGDFVWKDINRNGVQDVGEPGIEGVSVQLLDSSNAVIGTAITDTTGHYNFTDLQPGDYCVKFPLTADGSCTLTTLNTGTNTFVDSNASPADGKTVFTTLSPGENDTSWDAGYVSPLASLGDFVWKDLNKDGQQQTGEPGIAGVTVTLLTGAGVEIGTTPTDSTGHYFFSNLQPGSYKVSFPLTPQPNCVLTTATQGATDTDSNANTTNGESAVVTLVAGQVDATIDAGYISTLASLGNLVWFDANNDGVKDPAEVGIDGVVVTLCDATGKPIDGDANTAGVQPLTATTGDDPSTTGVVEQGWYSFTNLVPGSYTVKIATPPTAYPNSSTNTDTADNQQDNDDNGNQATFGGAITSPVIVLSASENDPTVDFGLWTPASLGNLVFCDLNNDGLFDDDGSDNIPGNADDETGVAGVVLTLCDASGTPVDDPNQAGNQYYIVSSSGTGQYGFVNLTPGDYTVKISAPPSSKPNSSVVTDPADNNVDNNDNGIQPVAQGAISSPVIRLAPADNDLTIDFGLVPAKPTTWAAWQALFPLGGANGPAQNPDGDIYDNLQEFAFCKDPSSGVNTHCPLEVVMDKDGKINAVVTKVKDIVGLTYTLEYISDLALSGANGAGWTPVSTITPTIVDNGDGTLTCTYTNLESIAALANGKGFVRVKVDLASPATTTRTYAAGWMDRTITGACETFSNPFLECEVFSGLVDSNTSSSLNITTAVGTGNFASALVSGKSYYVEVLSGPLAGQRWNVIGGSGVNTIAVGTGTKALTANALAGASVIVHEARTIGDLFPPAIYLAGSNPNNADKILMYDPTSVAKWSVYYLADLTAGGQGIHWVKQGDNTLAPQDGLALDACQGIFIHHRAAAVSTIQIGHVRQNAMACPLSVGQNLVGTGYPLDQSYQDRAMTWTGTNFNGFVGGTDPVRADNVLFWKGDTTLNAENYTTYWLVDAGFSPYRRWSLQGDNALNSQDLSKVFKATRSSFYRSTKGNPNYVIPLGWTP